MKMMRIVFGFAVLIVLISGFQDTAEIPFIEPESELVLNMELYDLAWHPDGYLLAVATEVGIKIFDEYLQEVDELTIERGIFRTVTWSSEGNQIAAGGFIYPQSVIYVWDYDTANEAFTLHTHFSVEVEYPDAELARGISLLAWSPDGSKLASQNLTLRVRAGETIGRMQVWDTDTWELATKRFVEIAEPTQSLAWNAESTALAVGGDDVAFGYDIYTPGLGWTAYTNFEMDSIAWSSTNLVSMSEGLGSFYIVDGSTGDLIYIFDEPYLLPAFTAWSPDGRYLVIWISDRDNNTRMDGLLDVKTGEVALTFERSGGIRGIDWSAEGSRIALISYNYVLKVWNVSDLPDEPSDLPTLTPYPTDTPMPTSTPAPSDGG